MATKSFFPSITLLVLQVWLFSGAQIMTVGPYMGFFGPGLLGPSAGYRDQNVGRSYSCGASFGSCAKGQQEYAIVLVEEPTMLTALTTVNREGGIEGMSAVIRGTHKPQHGGSLGLPGLGGAGYYGGLGYGPLGFGGGRMGHGLMGALGGLGGPFGGLGLDLGLGQAPQLRLELTVVIHNLPNTVDALLVFTSAADQDHCAPEALGPVVTGPDHSTGTGAGTGGLGGLANSLLAHPGGGLGAQVSGPPAGTPLEREFGVMTKLSIRQGSNSFKINGLGAFRHLEDLAGRGLALCEDVAIGMEGKPVCTGKTFEVLFCARLGYSVQAPDPIVPPK